MTTSTYPVAEEVAARRLQRARRFIGGFYLSMGGVHLGIVAADPQLYRHFADDALVGFVREQWAAIVMANPAAWGLMLFLGETVIGMLLAWLLPVLAVVIPSARRDWGVRGAPATL